MMDFVKERNEALWSLDADKIKAFLSKYRSGWPEDVKKESKSVA